MVLDFGAARCHWNRLMNLADELLAGFVHTDQGELRIVGLLVNFEHVLHAGDKRGVGIRRDLPIFAQVRTQLVFLETFGRS